VLFGVSPSESETDELTLALLTASLLALEQPAIAKTVAVVRTNAIALLHPFIKFFLPEI
jgi:hypothetical protein